MKKIPKILVYSFGGLLLLLLVGLVVGYQADIPVETLKAKYAVSPSQFLEIDGLNVHYRDEGQCRLDSVPLVLIHGTGASLLTWNGWADGLKNDYRVLRLDLPAYGLTGPNANNQYSLDYYADFLKHFLDKLNVKRCVVGGNSLGGGVAWAFALKYPERVSKLILVDAVGYPMQSKSVPIAFQLAKIGWLKSVFTKITPRAIIESSLKNVYADDAKVTPELVQQYWNMSLREGNRLAFVSRMSATNKPDSSWQRIKTLAMPTLILWGAHDELIPLSVGERFHKDLANDTLIVYKNAGHVPMEEIPNETLRDVRAFLGETNF